MNFTRPAGALGALCALTACGLSALAASPTYTPRKPGSLTFAKDIAPIVYSKCAACHHQGEVAPFPLLSYSDVKRRAEQIASIVGSRTMPPWKIDSHGEFLGERTLTNDQIGMIQQWVTEGAKAGRSAPRPPTFSSEWNLGKPDVVLDWGRPFNVTPDGNDVFRNFVIRTNFTTMKFVRAVDFRPGNRAVVHHYVAFIDPYHMARRKEAQTTDGQPGYVSFGAVGGGGVGGFLGAWAPGAPAQQLPEGVATELPPGADIILQVHYHKDGKPSFDLSKMALYFTNAQVDKQPHILPLFGNVRIPAGESDYSTHTFSIVDQDLTIFQIFPHMHLLGRTMNVDATLPDGTKKPLIHVNNWDFNWQGAYAYKEPVHLPKGTRIELTATYDNSEGNPRNPSHPPRLVRFGEQTTDEMCIAAIFCTADAEHLTQGIEIPNIMGSMGSMRKNFGALRSLMQFMNW